MDRHDSTPRSGDAAWSITRDAHQDNKAFVTEQGTVPATNGSLVDCSWQWRFHTRRRRAGCSLAAKHSTKHRLSVSADARTNSRQPRVDERHVHGRCSNEQPHTHQQQQTGCQGSQAAARARRAASVLPQTAWSRARAGRDRSCCTPVCHCITRDKFISTWVMQRISMSYHATFKGKQIGEDSQRTARRRAS